MPLSLMIIFVWGTRYRHDAIGTIADTCPFCNKPTILTVVEHYKIHHIYWILADNGTLETTSMKCTTCGKEYNYDPAKYSAIHPGSSSLKEVAEQTNPELYEALKKHACLIQMVTNNNKTELDDRFTLAVKELSDFITQDGAIKLMLQLEQWPTLDTDKRKILLDDVDRFINQTKQIDQAVKFIKLAADNFPSSAGCFTAFLSAVAVVYISIQVIISLHWIIGILAFIIGGILNLIVYSKMSDWRISRWVNKYFIPEVTQRNINFNTVLYILESIDTKNKNIDEKIRNLAEAVNKISSVLLEDGATHPSSPAYGGQGGRQARDVKQ